MTAIRLPITRYYTDANGTDRDHVRIDGYIELTPEHIAQILGDVPAKTKALDYEVRNTRAALEAAGIVRPREQQDAEPPVTGETSDPKIGDYVLATKYEDGEAWDWWGLGWLDRIDNGRFMVVDSEGKQTRGSGYRRCHKISKECGNWLWNQRAELERAGAKLWDMAASFNRAQPYTGKTIGDLARHIGEMARQDAKPSDGVDANDAPEGYVAKSTPTPGDCHGCVFTGNTAQECQKYACMPNERKDRKSVFFVKREPAKPDADEAAVEESEYAQIARELAEAKAEQDECDKLIARQGDLLTAAVNTLHGGPLPNGSWSHHDIADLAKQCVAKCDAIRTELEEEKCVHATTATAMREARAERDRLAAELEQAKAAAGQNGESAMRCADERDRALAELAAERDINAKINAEMDGMQDHWKKDQADLAAMTELASSLNQQLFVVDDYLDRILHAPNEPGLTRIGRLGEIIKAARADADALAEALRSICDQAHDQGHPGHLCHRTGWVDDEEWKKCRAALAAHDARRAGK